MSRSHLTAWVLTITSLSALCVQPIVAQVVPDNTLPVGERSQVTGNPNVQIDGGARRGGNLFHSFSQFSVPTGGSAYFNNAADVQNIFSRVTGGSISNIDGVIRANGSANLFLLNPNGILFGSNASLNIGGSFVATTANSINFADNFQYSATNPQPTPLLTISVPVGLQMGANPGVIGVQGTGYDLSVQGSLLAPITRGISSTGLQVPRGKTLALVGGSISIEGGALTAEQGQIELGSVSDGQVSLRSASSGFILGYQDVKHFGDIRLSQQALADASGGGVIQIDGNNVSLTDGSILLISNQGTQKGGSIAIKANHLVEISGSSPDGRFTGGLRSQTIGGGSGANIVISTQQLVVRDGAAITTRSYTPAKGGNITVNAADSVQVSGFSLVNPLFISSLSTTAYTSGDAGNIVVSTGRLTALNGGTVASANFGTGRGGDVTVDATEAVEIIGQTILLSPSNVSASTYSFGSAGKVAINTSRLVIQNGGSVSTSTLAIGNAGSVIINARDSVEVSGTVAGAVTPSLLGSSATFLSLPLQQLLRIPPVLSGNSGDVTINTGRLSITNGARVDVSNLGTGNAGKLTVSANAIVLNRAGAITAATISGEGGNININVRDSLLLRNNGQITASAGGTGNGGNIRIDGGAIVAVPTENSDISANSVNARGGNVTINASGIFGIQFRPQATPLSDITATGANSNLSGTVQLNVNQLDPTSGLVALPTTVVDSSRLIAQGCPANQGSSFVITGRGGLPPTPEQQLDDDAEWSDRRRLVVKQTSDGRGVRSQKSDFDVSAQASTLSSAETPNGVSIDSKLRTQNLELKTPSNTPHPTPHTPITEATGWQITPAGEIFLVASTSDPTVQNRLHQAVDCQGK